MYDYEDRAVPYKSVRPLYVLNSYQKSTIKHYEYFRIDSSTYLAQQYFKTLTKKGIQILKSTGVVKLLNVIVDSVTRASRSLSGGVKSLAKIYYTGVAKEGEWIEHMDSFFQYKYWVGRYINNQRVGVWSEMIWDPNGDQILSQIDYDKDPKHKIFGANLAGTLSTDSIEKMLIGRWILGCEDTLDKRMHMRKCELYEGEFGDDCNSRFGADNYYEFLTGATFKRQRGEICSSLKPAGANGKWNVLKEKEELLLEISLPSKAVIRYKIWYLDRKGMMVADRI